MVNAYLPVNVVSIVTVKAVIAVLISFAFRLSNVEQDDFVLLAKNVLTTYVYLPENVEITMTALHSILVSIINAKKPVVVVGIKIVPRVKFVMHLANAVFSM